MADSKMVQVLVPEDLAGLVEQVVGHAGARRWGDFEFTLQEGAPVGQLKMKLTEPIKGARPRK
jgi:hypothetical protein